MQSQTNQKLDSLYQLLHQQKVDTSRVSVLEKISKEVYFLNIEKYKQVVDSMFVFAKRSNSQIHMGRAANSLGRYYQRIGLADSSVFYYKYSARFFEKLENKEEMAVAYGNLGGVFNNQSNWDSASYYLKKAMNLNTEIGSENGLFFNNYNLGILEESQGNPISGIEYLLKALENAKQLNDKRYQAYAESYIGVIYIEQEMYEEARKYIASVIPSLEELEDFGGLANQYVNLGVIYSEHESNYNKAIRSYRKAIENYEKVGNQRDISLATGNIGRNYIKLRQLDSAKIYLERALKMAELTNQNFEKGRILTNLGEVALFSKSYAEASVKIKEAIDFVSLYGAPIDLRDAYWLKSDLGKEIRDYKMAYYSHVKASELNDSIISAEKFGEIAELTTKYQTEQKEKENQQLRAEKAEQALEVQKATQRNWVLGLTSLGLILALGGSLKFYQIRRKKAKLEEQFNIIKARQEESNNIGMKLHDRVAKELESVQIHLQKKGELEVANTLLKTKNDLRKLSSELTTIPFSESSFAEQVHTLAATYTKEGQRVEVLGIEEISWELVQEEVKYNLFLILREAVSNANKHAKASLISIGFEENKNELSLTVTDNGKGFDATQKAEGSGLRNIKTRVKDFGGEVTLESIPDRGTSIFVQLAMV